MTSIQLHQITMDLNTIIYRNFGKERPGKQSNNSFRLVTGQSISLHRQFGIRVRDKNKEEHETLFNTICKKVTNTLSLGNAEFRTLEKFIAASKALSTALGNQAEVYSLITIENSSLAPERLAVAQFIPKFFSRLSTLATLHPIRHALLYLVPSM